MEVLGPPDAFGVDVEIIIRKHHIPHAFPAPVLMEAEAQSQQSVATLVLEELARREDFRGLPIITIDGETARDFDDAVLVRDLGNGNTELQVHIADVSHYVTPGSALDTEARVRGFIFPTAPCLCCRMRFRAACARCCRMKTAWC